VNDAFSFENEVETWLETLEKVLAASRPLYPNFIGALSVSQTHVHARVAVGEVSPIATHFGKEGPRSDARVHDRSQSVAVRRAADER
jgi:hypothetical protein